MKLYCATTNAGKLREFRSGARRLGFDIEPAPSLATLSPCEETGVTFEQNAIQKALYYSRGMAGYLFAEDSGIEAIALRGQPGIHSARFAGEHATDESNNALLLEKLNGTDDRAARYVCAIALTRDGQLVKTFHGTVAGEILRERRGSNGFGYDPLFYYPPFGCAFGETSEERKFQVSHRAEATRKMLAFLAESGAA